MNSCIKLSHRKQLCSYCQFKYYNSIALSSPQLNKTIQLIKIKPSSRAGKVRSSHQSIINKAMTRLYSGAGVTFMVPSQKLSPLFFCCHGRLLVHFRLYLALYRLTTIASITSDQPERSTSLLSRVYPGVLSRAYQNG